MAGKEFKDLIKIKIPYAEEPKSEEPPPPVVRKREEPPAQQEQEGDTLGDYFRKLNRRLRDAGVPPTPLGDGTMGGYSRDLHRQIAELDKKEKDRGR